MHLRRVSSEDQKLLTASCHALKEAKFKFTIDCDINPVINYRTMLEDEKAEPQLRTFNEEVLMQVWYSVYITIFKV